MYSKSMEKSARTPKDRVFSWLLSLNRHLQCTLETGIAIIPLLVRILQTEKTMLSDSWRTA
jgi:hypothetical protein